MGAREQSRTLLLRLLAARRQRRPLEIKPLLFGFVWSHAGKVRSCSFVSHTRARERVCGQSEWRGRDAEAEPREEAGERSGCVQVRGRGGEARARRGEDGDERRARLEYPTTSEEQPLGRGRG